MGSLAEYYIRQGGRIDDEIGPVYVSSPYVQRGHGIGSFLAGLFRIVKPVAIRGARALGREALHAGAQILTDIGEKTPDTRVKDIVAKRLAESAQRLLLKGRGVRKKRKRAAAAGDDASAKNKKRKTAKRPPVIKRDIFS